VCPSVSTVVRMLYVTAAVPFKLIMENYILFSRLIRSTVILAEVEAFWAATPCNVAVGYRRFGGPCCLYLQLRVSLFAKKFMEPEGSLPCPQVSLT